MFTCWMLFPTRNQQCQSTEGNSLNNYWLVDWLLKYAGMQKAQMNARVHTSSSEESFIDARSISMSCGFVCISDCIAEHHNSRRWSCKELTKINRQTGLANWAVKSTCRTIPLIHSNMDPNPSLWLFHLRINACTRPATDYIFTDSGVTAQAVFLLGQTYTQTTCRLLVKGTGSPYSIAERRVPELTPVLCSQPAGDVSHKHSGRLPLLSARPAVTPAFPTTIKRAATNFAAW